eukprot:1748981-Alexandrium_andersonii.AAC.1
MSASLVGSEMCIRDRSCTPPAIILPLAGVHPAAIAQCSGISPARRFASPVSYTHLTLPTICSV